MKLYYSPGACSLSPHIVALESGIACTTIPVTLQSHTLADGTDYYQVNPLGYVPMLELDDGTRLREGPAIVQYLADQAPDRHLAPPNGTLERYRLQGWLNFIASEVHKGFTPLFRPTTPEEYKRIARENLLGRLKWVDGELAGKQYLMGDRFTVADAYLFTVTNWGAHVGVDFAHLKNLVAYRGRVAARPAVQAAMKAEGLLA